jgi:hypothetical protein
LRVRIHTSDDTGVPDNSFPFIHGRSPYLAHAPGSTGVSDDDRASVPLEIGPMVGMDLQGIGKSVPIAKALEQRALASR